jgi:hypothetical protein
MIQSAYVVAHTHFFVGAEFIPARESLRSADSAGGRKARPYTRSWHREKDEMGKDLGRRVKFKTTRRGGQVIIGAGFICRKGGLATTPAAGLEPERWT